MNNPAHTGIGMTSQRTRERLMQRLKEKGISNSEVIDKMRQLPRHIFVDEALASRAYEETALPIGNGQTLSQPYVVARMTELVMQVAPKKVLEVGTGCGYQTALLANLVRMVYSVERIAALYQKAQRHLRELRLGNVRLRLGDGYAGWELHAPFDAILVTAAPNRVPDALLKQLADGGRLVIPVGEEGRQELLSITRRGSTFLHERVEPVSFVPMLQGITRDP